MGVSPAWNGVDGHGRADGNAVNWIGEEGRPRFTNVGRFLLALPSAYETQLPKVG